MIAARSTDGAAAGSFQARDSQGNRGYADHDRDHEAGERDVDPRRVPAPHRVHQVHPGHHRRSQAERCEESEQAEAAQCGPHLRRVGGTKKTQEQGPFNRERAKHAHRGHHMELGPKHPGLHHCGFMDKPPMRRSIRDRGDASHRVIARRAQRQQL